MADVGDGVDVTVEQELCMGIGDCRRMAPEAFLKGDGNTSYVNEGLAGTVALDVLIDVAYTCPNGAITVTRQGESLL